jgi:hypothetical protein
VLLQERDQQHLQRHHSASFSALLSDAGAKRSITSGKVDQVENASHTTQLNSTSALPSPVIARPLPRLQGEEDFERGMPVDGKAKDTAKSGEA